MLNVQIERFIDPNFRKPRFKVVVDGRETLVTSGGTPRDADKVGEHIAKYLVALG